MLDPLSGISLRMIKNKHIELRVVESHNDSLRVVRKTMLRSDISDITETMSPKGRPYRTMSGVNHEKLGSLFVLIEYDELKKELYNDKRRIGF